MKPLPHFAPLKEELKKNSKALVLLSSTPNIDSVSAGLGLAQALLKKGIDVQVASVAPMRVEFSRLVGVESVKQKIGNRNLVVSFPYSEENVEKVSYDISADRTRFDLIIAPKAGAKPLDPGQIDFAYAGAESDVTFMIGVSSFAELGQLYDDERNVIEGSITVAVTLFPASTFAKYHVDAAGQSSLCELMTSVVRELDLPLDQDSANNMLFGLDSLTAGLTSPTVTADTFETVAFLMRAGAKRQPIGQQGTLGENQYPYVPSSTPTPAQSQNTQSQLPNDAVTNGNQMAAANPFAAALSQNAQKSSMQMPANPGEMKG